MPSNARAVDPLIGALKDQEGRVRKSAAQALVSLYNSGKLESNEKVRILGMKNVMAQLHDDRWTNYYDYLDHSVHIDEGIGVTL